MKIGWRRLVFRQATMVTLTLFSLRSLVGEQQRLTVRIMAWGRLAYRNCRVLARIGRLIQFAKLKCLMVTR